MRSTGPLSSRRAGTFVARRVRRVHLTWRSLAILFLCLQATASFAESARNAAPSGAGPQIEAIWHPQILHFQYQSFDTYYSCSSLEQKIRAILELVGAQRPIVLRTNCLGAPSNNVQVQIAIATPIPATPQNVAAESTFDATDELLARLREVALPTAADLERFPAQWQTRRLSQIRDVQFTEADCDLLRDLHEQVLPRLAVRVTSTSKLNCHARASNLRSRLKYEALIPTPSPFG